MEFKDFANLCLVLKKTSKRLIKVQLINDFFIQYPYEEVMVAFDVLSGNYAREISKKEIGISTQTIFQVVSEYFEIPLKDIQKSFSKTGDIFKVIADLKITQRVLQETTSLKIEDVTQTLEQISHISGKNAQDKKKNKLLFLFSKTTSLAQRQVLVAYLSDLLKIGVNEGVLHESFVFMYFPKITCLHTYSNSLKRFLISQDIENEYFNILSNEFEGEEKFEVNIESYKKIEYSALEDLFRFDFPFTNLLIESSKNESDAREIVKEFKESIERVYSFNVSYKTTYNLLKKSAKNINSPPIVFKKPLQVMLGPRLYSFDEISESVDFPVFSDYKYDGLRLIIQNNYGEVKLFSRNLEDLTSQFSEIVVFMQDNFSEISCVLDGECLGFDQQSYEQVSFQTLSKRIMTKSQNLKLNLILGIRFFDILELEGEQIHMQPLKIRQKKLRELFEKKELNISKKFNSGYVKEQLESFFENK